MKLSEIMSQNDWAFVHATCTPERVNPKLIAAIGWHETHWGRLGMGKYGYYLGISCWTRTQSQYNSDKGKGLIDSETYRRTEDGHLYCLLPYKGLAPQVNWAISRFKGVVPFEPGYPDVLNIARNIWKPGNPEAWAKSVWQIYSNLQVDLPAEYLPSEPENIPSAEGELQPAGSIFQKIAWYLEQIATLLKEWV